MGSSDIKLEEERILKDQPPPSTSSCLLSANKTLGFYCVVERRQDVDNGGGS